MSRLNRRDRRADLEKRRFTKWMLPTGAASELVDLCPECGMLAGEEHSPSCTQPKPEQRRIESQFGDVDSATWCAKMADECRRHGREVEVIPDKSNTMIALARV